MPRLDLIVDAKKAEDGARKGAAAAKSIVKAFGAADKAVKTATKGLDLYGVALTNVSTKAATSKTGVAAIAAAMTKAATGTNTASRATNNLTTSLNKNSTASKNAAKSTGKLGTSTLATKKALDRNTAALKKNTSALNKVATASTIATTKVAKLRKTATRARGSFSGLARSALSLVAGLTAITLVRGAIKTITDFELTMIKVQGVTRATKEEFQEMKLAARELGATTIFTASEVGDSMLALGRVGFDVDESLGAVTGTLALAQSGFLDMGEAAKIGSNVIRQFGKDAKDMSNVADILVNTANSTNTTVRTLGEAFKFVGPIGKNLGVSLEETAAAIGVIGDSGVPAGLAGRALRQSFIQLVKPTDTARAALERLGLTAEDVNLEKVGFVGVLENLKTGISGLGVELDELNKITDPAEFEAHLQAMVDAGSSGIGELADIFSNQAVTSIVSLINNMDKLRDVIKSNTDDAAGEAERLKKLVDESLFGSLKRALSAVQELALSWGDSGLTKVLKNSLNTFATVIRVMAGAGTAAEKASGGIQLLAATFKGLAVTLGIGMLIGFGPVGIAIGLIIAALHLLQDEMIETGDDSATLKSVMSVIAEDIGRTASTMWDDVAEAVPLAIQAMKEFASDVKAEYDLMLGKQKEFNDNLKPFDVKDITTEEINRLGQGLIDSVPSESNKESDRFIFRRLPEIELDHSMPGGGVLIISTPEEDRLLDLSNLPKLTPEQEEAARVSEAAFVAAAPEREAAKKKAEEDAITNAAPFDHVVARAAKKDAIAIENAKRLQSVRDKLNGLSEKQLGLLEGLESQLGVNEDVEKKNSLAAKRRFDAAKKANDILIRDAKTLQAIGEDFGNSLNQALNDMLDGTKDLSEAMKDLGRQILLSLRQKLVIDPIVNSVTNLFNPTEDADGNLQKSPVQNFLSGAGVDNLPTSTGFLGMMKGIFKGNKDENSLTRPELTPPIPVIIDQSQVVGPRGGFGGRDGTVGFSGGAGAGVNKELSRVAPLVTPTINAVLKTSGSDPATIEDLVVEANSDVVTQAATDAVISVEDTANKGLTGMFGGMVEGIGKVLTGAFSTVGTGISDILGGMADLVGGALGIIAGAVQGVAAIANGQNDFQKGVGIASLVTQVALGGLNAFNNRELSSNDPTGFPSNFAKGGVFSKGDVTNFAKGGVVHSETTVPMATLGEAGRSEAILPLARTPDGDLGVRTTSSDGRNSKSGEVNIKIEVINQVEGVEVSQEQTTDENGETKIRLLIAKTVNENISNRGSIHRGLTQAYGLSRTASQR